MKFPVYNQKGEQIKEVELPKRLFGVAMKPAVIHQVVVAQAANARENLAHAKTRSEVSGGGKKPWKQKGTGHARQGSIRAPQWVGGGVTFGPRNTQNFSQKVNKKQKQAALAMCLSQLAGNKTLVIFDKLDNDGGKTKSLNTWAKGLTGKIGDLKNSKKFLLVMDAKDANLTRAAKNLKNVSTISAASLNCIDILKNDTMLISEKTIALIEKHYNKVKEKKETK
jgi:large subunit ribosomal protein L4